MRTIEQDTLAELKKITKALELISTTSSSSAMLLGIMAKRALDMCDDEEFVEASMNSIAEMAEIMERMIEDLGTE